MVIRDATKQDYDFILRINEENVDVLSPMDAEKLDFFFAKAEMVKIAEIEGNPAAFIIVLSEKAKDYQLKCYNWFSDRYSKFIYIDCIVIDKKYRHMGIGTLLYQMVFNHAKEIGTVIIAAGITTIPRNESSLRFHQEMGFHEVGAQDIRGGAVRVSQQIAKV